MRCGLYLLLPLSLLVPPPAQADAAASRTTENPASVFDLIRQQPGEIIDIRLETGLRQLIRDKNSDAYQPARLSFTTAGGRVSQWTIQVRLRGNSRRRICSFPPVKLKFDKAELEAAGLNPKLDELKLANQCRNSVEDEQYMLREHLAYQLYETVSSYAFRTRLVRLTYADSDRKDKETVLYGILIESSEELAARLQGQPYKSEKCGSHLLERAEHIRLATFQYMIGNTDWAIGNLHNVEIIKVPAMSRLIAVPYDFDYAGLVNTDYAVPHSRLSITRVTDRLYLGPNCTPEEVNQTIAHFQSIRPALLARCDAFSLLDKPHRREVNHFLADFYKLLENPESLARVLCEKGAG